MAVICPTVTAEDTHLYRQQMERIAGFAKRIHVDFMDGEFTPSKSPGLSQAWWPEGHEIDLHIMYKSPEKELVKAIKLKPNLVILHAESEGDFLQMAEQLHAAGIKVGLCLLPETEVSAIEQVIDVLDHVLIFAGKLGYFGGDPNIAEFVQKIKDVRLAKPEIELAWDGGVTEQNAVEIAELGIDVLNVGGFIQRADNPQQRYQVLTRLVS